MKLKKILAAVALAAAASGASAEVLDFGNAGSSGDGFFAQGFITHTAGTFDDYLFFSLSSPDYTAWLGLGTIADQPRPNGANITDLIASLYLDGGTLGAAGAGDVLFAELGAGDYISNGGLLPTGAYYFKVSGTAVGPGSSSYSYSAAVTPVPEPATYGMMLAGLGMLGAIAGRRKLNRG